MTDSPDDAIIYTEQIFDTVNGSCNIIRRGGGPAQTRRLIMDIAELKKRKIDLGFTNQMVANISGVPLGTVQKIFGNVTKAPRYETLQLIERALFPENYGGQKLKGAYRAPGDPYEPMHVAEDNLAFESERESYGVDSYDYDGEYSYREKKQGEYTIEDLMNTPEGMLIELIDGHIYDMAPPSTIHQILVSQVFNQIVNGIERLKGGCIPMVSPVGVKIDPHDEKNFLEPDIIVVCDRGKIHKDMVYGAPDLVVEVLSPSTKGKDLFLKLAKYQQAGVREYWIINPDGREVMVYHFESLRMTGSYTFDDAIPVEISGGRLVIDFGIIHRQLTDLFGSDY